MLSTTSLLNLNVETLFEQHNVADITLVNKKIQEMIEDKKEELRTMVGERYRDLLKAADTITAMQNSSQSLIGQVERLGGSCKRLNDEQLLGFKTEVDNVSELRLNKANSRKMSYFSTIIQIKLLTSLPELIWSHLDKEEYFVATELFIFSRHISAGLQLDSDNAILQKLPVARKQWEMLKPFYGTIRLQLLMVLQRPQISVELMVDCILALLQLEKCPLAKAFSTFLQLRTTAFQNTLSQQGDDCIKERIKARIIAGLRILYETLDLICQCFLEKGLLFARLKKLSEHQTPTVLSRMSGDDMEFRQLLPDIIANFKPNFDEIILSHELKGAAFQQWLKQIESIVSGQLKVLFDAVSDLQTVHSIKNEASALAKQFHVTIGQMGKMFDFTQNLDFYVLHYLPLINRRIHELIAKYWTEMGDKLYENVVNLLEEQPPLDEDDIWLERSDDLPDSLASALSGDIKSKQLLMRSKGYNSRIVSICIEFEGLVKDVMREIDHLLDDQCTRSEERQMLGESLRQQAEHCLTELAKRIQSFSEGLSTRRELFLLVSFCCALLEICPSVRNCLGSLETTISTTTTTTKTAGSSSSVLEVFTGVVRHLWMRIIEQILQNCNDSDYLPKTISYDLLLRNFANWELITLESNDADDDHDDKEGKVQSTFRLPTQPSISLQMYLHKAIEMLNKTVPQTLPRQILDTFNDRLLQGLYDHYRALLRQEDDEESIKLQGCSLQNICLQIYFDMVFLQNAFVCDRERKESFNGLRNLCREHIDPFDFELCSSQLLSNAKSVVNRYTCLLGLLTPLANQINSVGGVASNAEKDPNVLSLCSSSAATLWFPLLPVVVADTPSSREEDSPLMEAKRTVQPGQKQIQTPEKKSLNGRKTDAKSKSMSFFGSMSQEWFR